MDFLFLLLKSEDFMLFFLLHLVAWGTVLYLENPQILQMPIRVKWLFTRAYYTE